MPTSNRSTGASGTHVYEHRFTSLTHAKVVIEAWRREYNGGRPKKSLGRLTPAAYARQLAGKAVTVTAGL